MLTAIGVWLRRVATSKLGLRLLHFVPFLKSLTRAYYNQDKLLQNVVQCGMQMQRLEVATGL